jgi:hypothetical protein
MIFENNHFATWQIHKFDKMLMVANPDLKSTFEASRFDAVSKPDFKPD